MAEIVFNTRNAMDFILSNTAHFEQVAPSIYKFKIESDEKVFVITARALGPVALKPGAPDLCRHDVLKVELEEKP